MKKFLILTAALFLLGAFTTSKGTNLPKAKNFFNEGNAAYQKQDYQTAIKDYSQALEYGNSPDLYYNLGNAYFKNNDLPDAILNYERARRLAPSNEDIQNNLKLANTMTADKITPIPRLRIAVWWDGMMQKTGSTNWALVAILLMILGVFSWGTFMVTHRSSLRRIGFFVGIGLVFLSLVAFKISLDARNAIENQDEAIVFQPKLDVHSAPDNQSTTVFVIHEGAKVRITHINDDWYEIKLANGNVGWVPKKSCEII